MESMDGDGLQSLTDLGIDAAGKEADGRYHAESFLSTPRRRG